MIKNGQMTLFVILGIVVVGVLVLGFYFREQIVSSQVSSSVSILSSVPPDLESLKEEVNNCANQVSEEALYLVGQQGGYFFVPEDALNLGLFPISFGVKSNNKVLVSENKLKEEAAAYVAEFLPGCVDFTAYNDYQILDQTPSVNINFQDESTSLIIDYQITAQKDGNAYNLLEPYEVVLPLRVKKLYEAASNIADDFVSSTEELDTSRLLSYGVDAELYPIGDRITIVYLNDNRDDNINYEFVFGVAQ